MRLPVTACAASLCLASHVAATFTFLRGTAMDIGPDDDTVSAEALHKRAETFNGWGTFDQLIDHANPALGTFKQRYWYGTEFWKGPGSPIYLVTPGEQDGTGFNRTWLSNARLTGVMANQTGGAVIILEHRYWGESSPYQNLTVQNLKYLTLDNSLQDLVYFAKTFAPPFDTSGKSAPTEAPWVVVGGSYSGALSAWLAAKYPGTFWAYYSSSGVVEAVGDFWSYFAPVQAATPKNCSADVNAVINYIDFVLTFGSPQQKADLKNKFMLGDLEDADFASAIESGPWQWQSGQFYSITTLGYTPYYRFCDYIENVWPNSTNKVPGPWGVGLSKALDGYAKYFTEEVLPGACESSGYDDWKGKYNTRCFQSLNASNVAYKDLSPSNYMNRQWMWMLCNEPFEWWQDGAPLTERTLVSRHVNVDYWRRQCPLAFPPSEGGYALARGKRAKDVNRWTGGWSVTNTTRAMHTNGEWDPWRDATLSSDFRPGGPLKSTKQLPVRVVKHGTHCSELYGPNWDVNPEVKALAMDAAANMKEWVGEFYEEKGRDKPWAE
ncbi:40fb040e-439d-4494-9381-05300f302a92 [Thermothielavioides terrestris]|uniref:40fb040e-439d-4494-9381-05300f302a92 n=1 Tax=Thermothielavioides terrestris TaxID=2587410 RepID=A0A3S4AUP6_9PEZI|nr:40fb040e-439d-4494-9381-05300f302a92 [Thermothielavioides terrestris]